ncbi:hypothetical protein [Nesterenkonia pannonica]|uniref:hypothetical protein n=1 Tax=Nesterenkonia pannonica TaxID=1548602 RepID=UPI00216407E7|nr:hypothetical protein [Nesterenkonia pannonica]
MAGTATSYPTHQGADQQQPRALTGARVILSGRRVLHMSLYAWIGVIAAATALLAVGWPVVAAVYSSTPP